MRIEMSSIRNLDSSSGSPATISALTMDLIHKEFPSATKPAETRSTALKSIRGKESAVDTMPSAAGTTAWRVPICSGTSLAIILLYRIPSTTTATATEMISIFCLLLRVVTAAVVKTSRFVRRTGRLRNPELSR